MTRLLKAFKFQMILFAFAVSQTVSPPAVLASSGDMPADFVAEDLLDLRIPPEIGKIEAWVPGDGPTLIHIQTAHGHYPAQKKIRDILNFLRETYGIRHIFVEGSAFNLDPEMIRYFPGAMDVTRCIADDLARKAVFRGVELFLLDSPDAAAYGIEDLDAYKANKEAFRAVLSQAAKTEVFVRGMDRQIEYLTSPYLNKDLRAFLGRLSDYEAGNIPVIDWLVYLKIQSAKYLKIDLTDPSHQLDWPMLVRFFTLQGFEQKIAGAGLEQERELFLRSLKRILDPRTQSGLPPRLYESLEEMIISPGAGGRLSAPAAAVLFESMVRALPQDFSHETFPRIRDVIGCRILQSEITGEGLMTESEHLTRRIEEQLAGTRNEKEMIELLRGHRLLKKLFALQLTPKDYARILAAHTQRGQDALTGLPGASLPVVRPSGILQRAAELNREGRARDIAFEAIPEIDLLYERALEFYRGVKSRDDRMIKNITRLLFEIGEDRAVIITGGFHAEPFRDYFGGKDFNYALISPAIAEHDLRGQEAYVRHMLNSRPHVFGTATLESDSPAMNVTSRISSMGTGGTHYFLQQELIAIGEALILDSGLAPLLNQSAYASSDRGYGFQADVVTDPGGKAEVVFRATENGFLSNYGMPETRIARRAERTLSAPILGQEAGVSRGSFVGMDAGSTTIFRSEIRNQGLTDSGSPAEIQLQIARLFRMIEGAKTRAGLMKKFNRELTALFNTYRSLKQRKASAGETEAAVTQILAYAERLEALAKKIAPDRPGHDSEEERQTYQRIETLSADQLKNEAQEIYKRLQKEFIPAFVRAHHDRDDEELDRLNVQVIPLYKARIKMQLLRTAKILRDETMQRGAWESAVLTLTASGLHPNYLHLAQEYAWQWRRAVKRAATHRIELVGRQGRTVTTYDYSKFRLFVEEDQETDEKKVTLRTHRWRRVDLPDSSVAYELTPTDVEVSNLDTASRMQVKILLSQEKDYGQILFRINALDYVVDLLETYQGTLTEFFTAQIRENLEAILEGDGGLGRGKVRQKTGGAENIRAAMSELEAGKISGAVGFLKATGELLNDRLKEIEDIREGIYGVADYLAHQIRKEETFRAVKDGGEVTKLILDGKWEEAFKLLKLIYETHYLNIVPQSSRERPFVEQYRSLQQFMARLRDHTARAETVARESQPVPHELVQKIQEDLKRIRNMSRPPSRSEIRRPESRRIQLFESFVPPEAQILSREYLGNLIPISRAMALQRAFHEGFIDQPTLSGGFWEALGISPLFTNFGEIHAIPSAGIWEHTFGEGPLMISENFFTAFRATVHAVPGSSKTHAGVFLDFQLMETMARENPRALYLLLDGFRRIQDETGSVEPFVTTVAPEDFRFRLMTAVNRKGAAVGLEIARLEDLLDRIESGRLIRELRRENAESVVAATNRFISQHPQIVTLSMDPSVLEDLQGETNFAVGTKIHPKDLPAIALVALLLKNAADLIRDIEDPAERVRLLDAFTGIFLPGTQRVRGGRVVSHWEALVQGFQQQQYVSSMA